MEISNDPKANPRRAKEEYPLATFGAGCFWCTEAVFQNLRGISNLRPGYAGGIIENPTYEEVVSGTTGHAEVIQFNFDPKLIAYQDLLEVFWATHDPTTVNQQGADMGPQYRSVIFYHSDNQKQTAEEFKELIGKAEVYDGPIVTEIAPFEGFYPAEKEHLDYYKNNQNQPYCQFVIRPKVEKLKKVFGKHTKFV